jgi:hypothetical protein
VLDPRRARRQLQRKRVVLAVGIGGVRVMYPHSVMWIHKSGVARLCGDRYVPPLAAVLRAVPFSFQKKVRVIQTTNPYLRSSESRSGMKIRERNKAHHRYHLSFGSYYSKSLFTVVNSASNLASVTP